MKKRVANAPTDATEPRKPIATAFTVAIRKKSIKTANPASPNSNTIPTYNSNHRNSEQ